LDHSRPPAGLSAAKKSTGERFDQFYSQALSSTPVKLADGSYKELTEAPRDYTVAVLLTALEARFGCQLCREFQPEWDLLSRSWLKGDKAGNSRLIFGTLDFAEGRDTFMSVSSIILSRPFWSFYFRLQPAANH
jgi:oligosaccharyltransferase complex subunit gamma